MQLSSAQKWLALAAVVLLVVAAIWVAYGPIPGCYLGVQPRAKAPAPTLPLGEDNMSMTYAQSQIQHANDANFHNMVLNSNVPVLVDFYADWCGPCQRLTPVLEELARETPGAKIVKVNVDHNPALASEYGVDSIPSLRVFRNGVVTNQLVGLTGKSQLHALLVP
jgi:thioredoxin 1